MEKSLQHHLLGKHINKCDVWGIGGWGKNFSVASNRVSADLGRCQEVLRVAVEPHRRRRPGRPEVHHLWRHPRTVLRSHEHFRTGEA